MQLGGGMVTRGRREKGTVGKKERRKKEKLLRYEREGKGP